MNVLHPGHIGRLERGTTPQSNALVPVIQNDELVTLTIDQVATGANVVDGPGSSTNNAFVRWDGLTGLLTKNSISTLDDLGNAVFSGSITSSGGSITGGTSGTVGVFDAYAPTAARGRLRLTAVNNAGDTITTIVNAAQADTRTYTVPDAGLDTSFVMDVNISDYEKFLGISDVINLSAGTWTITRVAQGDYVSRKTAADETAIIALDITEPIRVAASKGLSLVGLNYIFRNTTEALDAHTITLDRIEYSDSEAVSVNPITLSGSLGTATDADPQIDNISVTSPAFNNKNDSKYVLEITVNAAATSVYDFIGAVLTFTRNDF